MKKQASLALALCLTVIVGFAVVAYGSQLGFFKKSTAAGQDDTAAALIAIATYAAGFATTHTPTRAPEPVIVDEYIYEDVIVQPPASGAGASANEAGDVGPIATNPIPLGGDGDSVPHDDDDAYESHDDDDAHELHDDDDDDHGEHEREHGHEGGHAPGHEGNRP